MSQLQDRYIRFDWAIKRLLRQKANFRVLEGFLTVFLGEPITIMEILESKDTSLSEGEKNNWIGIMAHNGKDENIIIEIQIKRLLHYIESIYYGITPSNIRRIHLKERRAYDEHLNAIMIQNDVLNAAKLEGQMEGRMEGREEGRMEERLSNARNLKKMGVSPEIIAQATGLSMEEVAKLQ